VNIHPSGLSGRPDTDMPPLAKAEYHSCKMPKPFTPDRLLWQIFKTLNQFLRFAIKQPVQAVYNMPNKIKVLTMYGQPISTVYNYFMTGCWKTVF